MENAAVARPGGQAREREGLVIDPDRATIARCRQGERDCFEELVERHKAVVFSLVQRLVKNPTDAEDVAQETFVKAYLSLKRFRGECSFRNWLCQIATRLSIDHLRARRRKPVVNVEVELAGPDPVPHQVEARLEADLVTEAMSELPANYRAALELRHVHHFSYAEIAETLKVPLSTVKTHLLRGRFLLRRKLGPALGREAEGGDRE
jgi:RNA polymerase sigma-70 factor (ECF subfamily)